MIIEYGEIQKYNSDLHFKCIKESINNQIIEMKDNIEKSKNYIKTSVDIIEILEGL